MSDLAEQKTEARRAAFARRKVVHAQAGAGQADGLLEVLQEHKGRAIAGYMPIRTEIDPRPAMAAMVAHGPVGVPVIEGEGKPLTFARWTPETKMVPGLFGAAIPEDPTFFEPEVILLPLVAFTRTGGRLGYGGGFYDRTLEKLRAKRPTTAIGFAFAAQEAENLPLEPTDQPLDLIVTEQGVIVPKPLLL